MKIELYYLYLKVHTFKFGMKINLFLIFFFILSFSNRFFKFQTIGRYFSSCIKFLEWFHGVAVAAIPTTSHAIKLTRSLEYSDSWWINQTFGIWWKWRSQVGIDSTLTWRTIDWRSFERKSVISTVATGNGNSYIGNLEWLDWYYTC